MILFKFVLVFRVFNVFLYIFFCLRLILWVGGRDDSFFLFGWGYWGLELLSDLFGIIELVIG